MDVEMSYKLTKYIFALFMLCPASALAATSTTTFTVSATVTNDCSVSANNLSFGNYSTISANNVDATTTISVTCTLDTPYTVGLDAGNGSGATTTVRKMTSGENTLNYSLYSDVSRSTVWGNAIGTDTVAGTGSGAQQDLTVYGRIPGGQGSVESGDYTDVITVTVTY